MIGKEELRQALRQMAKSQMPPPNLVWGKVTEVDWDAKTCTATGLISELEFTDVPLSIDGSKFDVKKPKIDTTCILGVLHNKNTDAFMVWCAEYEEWWLNGDDKGGLVTAPELVDKINRLEDKLNSHIDKYNNHIHLGTGYQGATLSIQKTTSIETKVSPNTKQEDIESKKIKHGG